MINLVKAELLKLSKSLGYKVSLICTVGLGVLLGVMMHVMSAPDTNGAALYLQTLTETQSQSVFIGIFASIFICSEFFDRTFSMSLFSGCSRKEILLAKTIVFVVGTLPLVFMIPLTATITTTISFGFGDLNSEMIMRLIQSTLLYILSSSTLACFYVMLSVLIKNIGGTIGAGIGITVGMELMFMLPVFEPITKFFFIYQIKQLTHVVSVTQFIAVTSITLAVSLAISLFIFNKADLK